MGFRLNREYALQFEGDLEGAEVRMSGTSVAKLMEIRDSDDEKELAKLITPLIRSWNMDDAEGKPLPVTPEGWLELEPEVQLAIVRGWITAVTRVPRPLDDESTSGDTSLEASIPMAAPS